MGNVILRMFCYPSVSHSEYESLTDAKNTHKKNESVIDTMNKEYNTGKTRDSVLPNPQANRE